MEVFHCFGQVMWRYSSAQTNKNNKVSLKAVGIRYGQAHVHVVVVYCGNTLQVTEVQV
jgi:hypothetical protein